MTRLRKRSLRHACAAACTVLCGAVVWGAAPPAKDSAQAQARLASVRAQIAQLTNRLGDELKQRDQLSARLRDVELGIISKRRHVDALRAEQAAAQRRGAELRDEQTAARGNLVAERDALDAEVRAAYMIGRREELKLLLNQTNPAALGRALAYHGYLADERRARIEAIQRETLRLQQLASEIEEQSARLRTLEDDAGREMSGLELARAQRADALAAVKRQVAGGNMELGHLKREEQAVESLVAELSKVMQDFPADPAQSFDKMRGKLPWPVQGRVTARYQQQQSNSAPGRRLNGEMLEAARGAKVRAPYFGRVVYADWLQGLGLLLIIGHSGGFMTLYGHAEVLYKSVGDWVSPGDVIAALSDANGAAPQLYFEIREGRKTVDPRLWLRSNP